MSFLPVNNRIALKRVTPSPSASTAFLIPDSGKEKPLECVVVAVPALPYVTEFGTVLHCPAAVGQHVLVGKYTAGEQKVKVVGEDGTEREEDWLFLRWEELLAVESPSHPTYADAADAIIDHGLAAAAAGRNSRLVAHVGLPGSEALRAYEDSLRKSMDLADPPAVLTGAIPAGLADDPSVDPHDTASVSGILGAPGLPSAADLDRLADEQRASDLTCDFTNQLAEEGGQR